jgi:hypothetical protein
MYSPEVRLAFANAAASRRVPCHVALPSDFEERQRPKAAVVDYNGKTEPRKNAFDLTFGETFGGRERK